jgi:guanylate kinase
MKIVVPFVKTAGKKVGKWVFVTAVNPHKTSRPFTGHLLQPGDYSVPAWSVFVLLRYKNKEPVADVLYACPESDSVKGRAYGLPWGANHRSQALIAAVVDALDFTTASRGAPLTAADSCVPLVAMRDKKIIIVGPGAAGKDFLAKGLADRGYVKAVSCTTRPPRDGEVHLQDYEFITNTEFDRREKAGAFFESFRFEGLGWAYGTPQTELAKATLFIMSPPVLDSEGVRSMLADAVIVYLDPPFDTRKDRLSRRACADDPNRRLMSDNQMFQGFTRYNVRITDPNFSIDSVVELVRKH